MAAKARSEMSYRRRVCLFLVGVLECSMFGGMVFGWPQLVLVLKQEGIYAGLCDVDVAHHNITTHPDAVTTHPDAVTTHPDAVTTHPDTVTTHPGAVTTHPDAVATHPDAVTTHPDAVATHPGEDMEVKCESNSTNGDSNSQAERWRRWKQQKCDTLNDTDALCSTSTTSTCLAQDKQYAFVYTVAVVMYALPSIVVGFLLHYAGLWVARILASLMLVVSFCMFALLTTEREELLLPALMLLAMGGNQLRLCAVQLGDLFPKRRSMALNLLMGSYSISASVFFVFQVAADAGLPRSVVCWTLAAVSAFSLVVTFTMPRHHVSLAMIQEPSSELAKRTPTHEPVPLKISLTSASSNLHIYWLCSALFALNGYQQMFNFWITTSSCSARDEQHYTMLFSLCGLVGAALAPVLGHMTDSMVSRAKREAKDAFMLRVEEVCAHFLPLLITTFFILLMFSCELVFSSSAIYVSLIGLVFCRSCIFSTSTAFLRARFPVGHMDRLMGIYNTIAAMLVWLVYPFFTWQMKNYYAATLTGLFFIVLNASYPLHLLFKGSIRRALLELPQPKSIQTNSLLHRAPSGLVINDP